jgi:hypothetical protein
LPGLLFFGIILVSVFFIVRKGNTPTLRLQFHFEYKEVDSFGDGDYEQNEDPKYILLDVYEDMGSE